MFHLLLLTLKSTTRLVREVFHIVRVSDVSKTPHTDHGHLTKLGGTLVPSATVSWRLCMTSLPSRLPRPPQAG